MPQTHLRPDNRIGMPTALFASAAFNLTPLPTHIEGVREAHRDLFDHLASAVRPAWPEVFTAYVASAFGLEDGGAGRKRFSYLRLLRGWFFDSNQLEGAIMKGWAESRFGLVPLFHREPIEGPDAPAYARYRAERDDPRLSGAGVEALFAQLDLLYEYAQAWLDKHGPRPRYLVLYRGANRVSPEHRVREERETDLWVVRNNCLVSYTADPERADEFGDVVLKVEAPFPKVLCFPALLPGRLPHFEAEHILIGGDYLSAVGPFLGEA
jgi:NAD+--dinitrogen-reductase ADP-D-ribosyltransferase